MRDDQKQRRAKLEALHGRPDPQAVRRGMREVFEESLRGAKKAVLCTDKHKSYPPALRGTPCDVDHQTVSSKDHRDKRNRLFEINSLDRFIRHSSANHGRETLAWSKRRQCSAERFAVFMVWKNCVKRRWERGPLQTPAMLKGLLEGPLRIVDILRERLFVNRFELPPRWREYYYKLVETPVVGRNRRHELKNAL